MCQCWCISDVEGSSRAGARISFAHALFGGCSSGCAREKKKARRKRSPPPNPPVPRVLPLQNRLPLQHRGAKHPIHSTHSSCRRPRQICRRANAPGLSEGTHHQRRLLACLPGHREFLANVQEFFFQIDWHVLAMSLPCLCHVFGMWTSQREEHLRTKKEKILKSFRKHQRPTQKSGRALKMACETYELTTRCVRGTL